MCNKNLTGGDFLGGVPKEVFDAKNPCGMQAGCGQACTQAVGEAGDRAVLEQATMSPVSGPPTTDQEGDDPRFARNNGLQMEQTVVVRGQWVD